MKKPPCAMLGMRINPKMSVKPDAIRNSSAAKVSPFSACVATSDMMSSLIDRYSTFRDGGKSRE